MAKLWECGACGSLVERGSSGGKPKPLRHSRREARFNRGRWFKNRWVKGAVTDCPGHLVEPTGVPPVFGWGPK